MTKTALSELPAKRAAIINKFINYDFKLAKNRIRLRKMQFSCAAETGLLTV